MTIRSWLRGVRAAVAGDPPLGVSRGVRGDGDGFVPVHQPLTVATAYPVVWACVNIIADAVARSQWQVRNEAGQPLAGHPYAAALSSNRYGPNYRAWRTVAERYAAAGNAYAIMRRTPRGVFDGIEPAVDGEVARDTSPGAAPQSRVYLLSVADGVRRVYPSRDVIAIHGPGYDGVRSPSPIQHAARTPLKLMGAAQTLQIAEAEAGLTGRAVITMDDPAAGMTVQQLDALARGLEERYAGARNAGRVPVLPAYAKPDTMGGVSPADLQIVELLRWTVEDLCRVFNVPPRAVFHYIRGFRVGDFEGQAVDLQRWSIERPCADFGGAATHALFASTRNTIALDSSGLSAGTFGERVTAAVNAVRGGVLTPNEVRPGLGEQPHTDGNKLYPPAGVSAEEPASNEGNET